MQIYTIFAIIGTGIDSSRRGPVDGQESHTYTMLLRYTPSRSHQSSTDLYQLDADEMLLRTNLNNCFDRHGTAFCEAFVTRSGRWVRSLVTCQHSAFAFRVCRKTCGYCSAYICKRKCRRMKLRQIIQIKESYCKLQLKKSQESKGIF
uniref:ShKT domain-containing protein n=1 Tax=Heterorhabditis bacteriophora TaxID=37862 RepID=A0A1I7WUZ8_HETBA